LLHQLLNFPEIWVDKVALVKAQLQEVRKGWLHVNIREESDCLMVSQVQNKFSAAGFAVDSWYVAFGLASVVAQSDHEWGATVFMVGAVFHSDSTWNAHTSAMDPQGFISYASSLLEKVTIAKHDLDYVGFDVVWWATQIKLMQTDLVNTSPCVFNRVPGRLNLVKLPSGNSTSVTYAHYVSARMRDNGFVVVLPAQVHLRSDSGFAVGSDHACTYVTVRAGVCDILRFELAGRRRVGCLTVPVPAVAVMTEGLSDATIGLSYLGMTPESADASYIVIKSRESSPFRFIYGNIM